MSKSQILGNSVPSSVQLCVTLSTKIELKAAFEVHKEIAKHEVDLYVGPKSYVFYLMSKFLNLTS